MATVSTMTKLGFSLIAAFLTVSPAFAFSKKYNSILKGHVIHHKVPFEFGASERGLHLNYALTDGTVTGPVSLDGNGG
jgi:hypothetical protein